MTRGTRSRMLLLAYNRGRAAWQLGLPLMSCPYPNVQEYKDAWERGWQEGKRKWRRSTTGIAKELSALTHRGKATEDR